MEALKKLSAGDSAIKVSAEEGVGCRWIGEDHCVEGCIKRMAEVIEFSITKQHKVCHALNYIHNRKVRS